MKTLILYNLKARSVSVLYYDEKGMLVERKEYGTVSRIQFRREVSVSTGLALDLIVYTVEGKALVEKKGATLWVV